ncbi:MAG: CheR family methyltransferase [Rhodanobacteraceae bacterium]
MSRFAARRWLKVIPGVQKFAQSARGQALRHRLALYLENRKGFTFTQFLRLPSQLDALSGPVMDFVNAGELPEPVRIVVIGCSSGAEPYTIASVLLERRPDIAFTIDAYDVDADVLTIARAAKYPADLVLDNPLVTRYFIANTFEQDGDQWTVKPQVARHVRFHLADATDVDVRRRIPAADIVFAQNVMCNLQRPKARRLFENVAALLKSRSALFLAGMDLDMRQRRTRLHSLVPLTFALEQVHDEARLVLGERYPWYAAGLEPFSPLCQNPARRYSTIFIRGAGANDFPAPAGRKVAATRAGHVGRDSTRSTARTQAPASGRLAADPER